MHVLARHIRAHRLLALGDLSTAQTGGWSDRLQVIGGRGRLAGTRPSRMFSASATRLVGLPATGVTWAPGAAVAVAAPGALCGVWLVHGHPLRTRLRRHRDGCDRAVSARVKSVVPVSAPLAGLFCQPAALSLSW